MTVTYPSLEEKKAWLQGCQDGVLYDATDYYAIVYDRPAGSRPRHPQAYVRIHLDRLRPWAVGRSDWKDHATKCALCGGDQFWALIDEDLAQTIYLIWQLGIPTRNSCQGGPDGWVWITFWTAEDLWQFVFAVTAMDREMATDSRWCEVDPTTFVSRVMRNFTGAVPDVTDAWRYDHWNRSVRFPPADFPLVDLHLAWWRDEQERLHGLMERMRLASAVAALLAGTDPGDEDGDDDDEWDDE